MSAKAWFITGTSRGFGREWVLAALERGDSVAATARNAEVEYHASYTRIIEAAVG